jgi:NitT/TauT family transport system ATP-binding protein
LDEVGLQDAAKKYPWQLSGGMQQRVAIARALATRPTLLCLDEPFGALDAQTRMELQDLILTLSRKHSITNVLVTHDLDEAVYMSDKILILLGPKGESRNIEVPLSYPREQIQTRQEKSFLELRALLGSEISPKH